MFDRNTDPVITHPEQHFVLIGDRIDVDSATFRGELDGVTDQVGKYLKDSFRVRIDHQALRGGAVELDVLFGGQHHQQAAGFFQQAGDAQWQARQLIAAGFDLRCIEQVFQQAVHARRGFLDGAQRTADIAIFEVRVAQRPALHHAALHNDDRHWVAQVMGDHGDQFITQTNCLLLALHLTLQIAFQSRATYVFSAIEICARPRPGNAGNLLLPDIERLPWMQTMTRGTLRTGTDVVGRVAAPVHRGGELGTKPHDSVINRLG